MRERERECELMESAQAEKRLCSAESDWYSSAWFKIALPSHAKLCVCYVTTDAIGRLGWTIYENTIASRIVSESLGARKSRLAMNIIYTTCQAVDRLCSAESDCVLFTWLKIALPSSAKLCSC